ncbi:unnamed protein product [Cylindrotheca closterium]|uniref:2Fe-2S ferredoxin-type domain-containing protein n=1 Tax=Cylindrotheca closterium TaxID=2856 RepID=A0AAD2PY66_9STRA|nr:unnamed protein product [Cylindrotheca closterium]
MMPSSVSRLATRALTRSIPSLLERSAIKKAGSKLNMAKRTYSRSFELAKNTVSITYVDPDGEEITVDAEIGQNLLHVAHDNNVELEGACGAELACSTCHLIFEQDVFDKLPEMTEEEEDMLDLAFEVTDTSRLGCQILVREDFEGMKVQIPDDGF